MDQNIDTRDFYLGYKKNGKAHGKGFCKWSNGDQYTGDWKDHMKHGNGTYNWHDGLQYNGEWKNGTINGYGVLTYSNGNKCKGIWKNGTPTDDVKCDGFDLSEFIPPTFILEENE